MAKYKLFDKNPFLDIFKGVFVGMFGAISAYMILSLYTILFIGIGFYMIKKYNKPNTKLFNQFQTGQYIGSVFTGLGLLPWIQYFFMGLMSEGGGFAAFYAIDSIASE